MNYHEFLRNIPKAELHIHLEEAVRPLSAVEIAGANGITIPTYESHEDIYRFKHAEFFNTHSMISHLFRTSDDFRRTTYETLEDASLVGVRYREMFWNPILHLEDRVSYKD